MPLPVEWISRQQAALMPRPPSGWLWPSRELVASRPEIVTLCGSTRFVDEFNKQRQRLTLQGIIVLSIEIVTTQMWAEDPQHTNRKNKEMLDALHLRKIDISDRIFVIDVGGYIGESTRKEIAYADGLGIPVTYLERIHD